MAEAVAISFDPANPARYYVALTNYQVRAYGPDLPRLDIPIMFTNPPDQTQNYLVGFQCTFFGSIAGATASRGYYLGSHGLVYSFGGTPGTGFSGPLWGGTNQARALAVNPAANGKAVVLSMKGAVRGSPTGGLPDVITNYNFDADIARDIWVAPDSWGGTSPRGYILSMFGDILPFGPGMTEPAFSTFWDSGADHCRAIDSDGTRGYYMLRGGQIRRFGPSEVGLPPEIVRRATWLTDEGRDLKITTSFPWTTSVAGLQLDRQGGVTFPRSGTAPTAGPASKPLANEVIDDTNYPELAFPYDDPDGDPMSQLEVWVYRTANAPVAPPANDVVTGEPSDIEPDLHWYSGLITNADVRSVFMGYPVSGATGGTGNRPLTDGAWTVFWRAADRFQQPSPFYRVNFSLKLVPPVPPFLEVEPMPSRGQNRVRAGIVVNRLSAQQSNPDAATALGLVPGLGNPLLARDTTQVRTGAASVRVTSQAAGDMSVKTEPDPVTVPGVIHTAHYSVRKGSTSTGRVWVPRLHHRNASGTVIATREGAPIDTNDTDTSSPLPVAAFGVSDETVSAGEIVQLNGADSITANPGQTLTFNWSIDPPVAPLRDHPVLPGLVKEFTAPTLAETTTVDVTLRVTNQYGESDALTRPAVTIQGTSPTVVKPIAFGGVTPTATPDPLTEIQLNFAESQIWSEAVGAPLAMLTYQQTEGPVLELRPNSQFGFLVMHATVGAVGTRSTWTVTPRSTNGQVGTPATVTVEVRRPPTTGTLLPFSSRSVKGAVAFTTNLDDSIRWDVIGHIPLWTHSYPTRTSWDALVANIPQVAAEATPMRKKVLTFPFLIGQTGANTLLGRTANTTEFDAQMRRVASAIAGLPQTVLDNLVINLSHEHTGYWYAWAVQYGDGTNGGRATGAVLAQRIRDFKTAYRKMRQFIVQACTSAGRARPPKFATTAAMGAGGPVDVVRNLILDTYPGDSYVDLWMHNNYARFENSRISYVRSNLEWWKNVLRGVQGYRRNDAGAFTSGQPKLGGMCEMAIRLITDREVSQNPSNPMPTMGDDPAWYDAHFEYVQDLVRNGPGIGPMFMYEVSPAPEWRYHSVLQHTSGGGIHPQVGRGMLITDPREGNPGQFGIVSAAVLAPGPYSCFNGVARAGFTPTRSATHQSPARKSAARVIDWIGGPLVAGVDY